MMGGATAHTGVEPCVGPKTIVMSFPRVMIISLLALAKYCTLADSPRRDGILLFWANQTPKLANL